jgi:Arc/MetJ-type ribon-helix-helix transcriptional regulator
MDVSLPADLTERLQQEVAAGHYPNTNAVIEHALRRFLEEQHRGADRLEALRRIGSAVDQVGLYERVLLPDSE